MNIDSVRLFVVFKRPLLECEIIVFLVVSSLRNIDFFVFFFSWRRKDYFI